MELKSKKKTEETDDSEEYDYITVPTDGGYGWVVLVACFLINWIVDGFLYAFGAFSKDIKRSYQCPEWAVSAVISLACGFYLLSAPVASALCNKFGCRPVGIAGSIIASVAIGVSILSPNIYVMWLFFGFVGGIGMGLVYLPSLVMVGYYFEKKRAIATGIVTAGTGIGSITFGPLSRYLFDVFQWKTGLLILATILLGCAICCAFMRPLKPIRKRRVVSPTNADDNVFGSSAASPTIISTKSIEAGVTTATGRNASSDAVPKPRGRTDSTISTKSRQSIKAEDAVRPLYKEDVLYQGDTRDLPEFQCHSDVATYVQETTKVPETTPPSRTKAFWDTFVAMTNIDVLQDKRMVIICLANVCSMIGYYAPYLFIVKVAEDERSIPSAKAVYLLSIIGFSNTIVRFVSGLITKIPYMSPLLVNNIGLFVAGLVTLFVPLCSTHGLLITYCVVWGGFIAFHVSLSPIIVCQLVGLEKYSSALGLTLMFRGITSLAAPPIMGAIRDVTNSFDIPFIIAGASFIVSALMHFVVMWLMHRQTQAETKESINREVTAVSNPSAAVAV